MLCLPHPAFLFPPSLSPSLFSPSLYPFSLRQRRKDKDSSLSLSLSLSLSPSRRSLVVERSRSIREIMSSIPSADHPDRLFKEVSSITKCKCRCGSFNIGPGRHLAESFPLPYLGSSLIDA